MSDIGRVGVPGECLSFFDLDFFPLTSPFEHVCVTLAKACCAHGIPHCSCDFLRRWPNLLQEDGRSFTVPAKGFLRQINSYLAGQVISHNNHVRGDVVCTYLRMHASLVIPISL